MEKIIAGRNSLWGRLTKPHSAVTDPDRRARARVLASFMLLLSILLGLMSIVYILAFGPLEPEFWLAGNLFFIVYLLSRSPKPDLGEYTVVSGLTGIVAFIHLSRGTEALSSVWVLIPILVAAVLLPMWATITFTLLNISILIAIELIAPPSNLGPILSAVFFLIFTSIIALATKYAREQDQEKLEQQTLALAKSSASYKQLFDDVPIGLFESTPTGEILQANQALLQILRFPDQQALQAITTPELYVDPTKREEWMVMMEEQGSVEDFEVELIRSDQQKIWIRERVRATRNQVRELSHFRGSMEDVTQRRWLQMQLAEKHQ
jgi:PAS domain S-box-containing protein